MLRKARRGQAMVEYVIVLCSLLAAAGILWGLVRAAERHAKRTQAFVTMDCP